MRKCVRSRRLGIEQVENRLLMASSRPSLSVNDVQVIEGDSGTKMAAVTASLSKSSSSTVKASFKTVSDTASAGTDFTSITGSITFRPGETTKTINVSIKGDTVVESTESFKLALSSVKNATLSDGSAKITIVDNDSTTPTPTPTPDPTPTPTPSPTYGVTSAIGPQSGVTVPAGAIVVSASQTTAQVQSIINSAADGATIFFRAGTYTDLSIVPKTGQKFIGEYGAVLTSATQTAAIRSSASNVTVRNLVIDGYVPAQNYGSVHSNWGAGWILDHVEVRNSAARGVSLFDGSQLTNSYIHDNGQLGVKVGGFAGVPDRPEYRTANGAPTLISNTRISRNNLAGLFDPSYEAGGIKLWMANNVTLQNLEVDNNGGSGIWVDTVYNGTVIRNSWSHDNTESGIYLELANGSLVENNLVERNSVGANLGARTIAGISIHVSSNTTVRNNVVRDNNNGILARSESSRTNEGRQWLLQNVVVEYNTITMSQGLSGLTWDNTALANPYDGDVRWDYNTYTVSGTAGWIWNNWEHSKINWSQWRAYGNDLHGTLK